MFNIFNKLLKNEPTEQTLNELKDIDYFYYKIIQSFIRQMPQRQIKSGYIQIDTLTIIYDNKIFSQNSNITEIDHYTLSNSLLAKDVISGLKTDLMIQALPTETGIVKFNLVSPDWHSSSNINRKSIELSQEILNKYRDNIKSAWNNFLCSENFFLKFDRDKVPMFYKHLERVQ